MGGVDFAGDAGCCDLRSRQHDRFWHAVDGDHEFVTDLRSVRDADVHAHSAVQFGLVDVAVVVGVFGDDDHRCAGGRGADQRDVCCIGRGAGVFRRVCDAGGHGEGGFVAGTAVVGDDVLFGVHFDLRECVHNFVVAGGNDGDNVACGCGCRQKHGHFDLAAGCSQFSGGDDAVTGGAVGVGVDVHAHRSDALGRVSRIDFAEVAQVELGAGRAWGADDVGGHRRQCGADIECCTVYRGRKAGGDTFVDHRLGEREGLGGAHTVCDRDFVAHNRPCGHGD